MTSPSHLHTQARVQPRNTYNHTYIKFLPGQNNLTLNPDKSTCTMFTTDPAEYKSNLNLKINNTALPMSMHPKVLDLTLVPKLTYSTHIQGVHLSFKANSRLLGLTDPTTHNNFHWSTELCNIFLDHYIIILIYNICIAPYNTIL